MIEILLSIIDYKEEEDLLKEEEAIHGGRVFVSQCTIIIILLSFRISLPVGLVRFSQDLTCKILFGGVSHVVCLVYFPVPHTFCVFSFRLFCCIYRARVQYQPFCLIFKFSFLSR